jgi:adenylosuccinate lyase
MIELIRQGLTRESAYRLVQRNAMAAWKQQRDFKKLLLDDKDVRKKLPAQKIEKCFDIGFYLRNVDVILKRTGIIK